MPRKLSKSSLPLSSPTSSTSLLPPSLADPSLPLPKLIVFDLDYTLWPFWVDTHVTPPLKADVTHTSVVDRCHESFSFYGDVPSILYALRRAGVRLGVASRTTRPDYARDMLKLLHVLPPDDDAVTATTTTTAGKAEKPEKSRRAVDVFDGGMEIFPGSKMRHFENLQKRTKVAFEDILFFDDEPRNRETESLGITMWLVVDGVSWAEVEKGVEEWRTRRGFVKKTEEEEEEEEEAEVQEDLGRA